MRDRNESLVGFYIFYILLDNSQREFLYNSKKRSIYEQMSYMDLFACLSLFGLALVRGYSLVMLLEELRCDLREERVGEHVLIRRVQEALADELRLELVERLCLCILDGAILDDILLRDVERLREEVVIDWQRRTAELRSAPSCSARRS